MRISGKQIRDAVSGDASPSLSADLDVGTAIIKTTASNGNVKLAPDGTGAVEVRGNGSNDGALQLNCSNNSHGVTIKSPPHSAAATYTLTLPTNDGDANQVLKTDGSGGLSWVDQSSGPANTDTLSEGTTNLYYTDARADARIAAASLTDLVDVDFTAGAGIDNYVLTYDHSGSKWGAEAAGGARPSFQTITGTSITIGGTGDTNSPAAIASSELERIYKFTATSDVTVTLPSASVGAGFKLQLKSATTSTVKIYTASAETIDGTDHSTSSLDISTQYNSYTLVSDGSNWSII